MCLVPLSATGKLCISLKGFYICSHIKLKLDVLILRRLAEKISEFSPNIKYWYLIIPEFVLGTLPDARTVDKEHYPSHVD